ncbi:hypothetical protein M5M_19175 [Simiduia agarivorans SA1 = DSM 21679]|uniref:Ice-binding protein C-terminal domain-containing protein n=2 Tax=Simiduia TaxID=447467 RepID=K4KPJ2_SIMAS|nr:hypothetical protein M5M_19175 [Simiduia agarivorans SA1 = DSM 21679]
MLTAGMLMTSAAQALVVTDVADGQTLANNILGSGISISNVSYQGSATSSGTFTGGLASGLGFDTGVLLTTGAAQNAVGPNNETGKSTNFGGAGDSDLTALSGYSTNDATVLSFDFEFDGGLGGDLFFNIVFASEEYNEFVGTQFNDVFGLFVDGNNVAKLPNGDPLSINTVNNNVNSDSYIDNETGSYDIQYDGFTKSIGIKVLGLSAGLHSMKFAIADGSDFILDSGIFIQASSFSDTPVGVPEPGPLLLLSIGLLGLGAARQRLNRQ